MIYWVGYTQKFSEGDWRNGYYHGFCEASNAEEAIKIWYPSTFKNIPGDQLQVFECGNNFERILVHTVEKK